MDRVFFVYTALAILILDCGENFACCEEDSDLATNETARFEAYTEDEIDEERPWCPPSAEIFPCTCDGPRNFRLLTCDRIEDAYVITTVTRSVEGSRSFGKFSLTNSRLLSLETNVLNFLHFEYIYARKNTVKTIESVFFESSRNYLKRIEIVHNDLEKFPFKELATFSKLEYIDLKYNSLKKIPDEAFGKSINRKLKKIDLSFNKINYVGSNAFKYLCTLEQLDLSFNRLTVVNNNAFAGMLQNPNLVLNVAHNKIIYIADGAFSNQLFKCLNISNNNIGKFREKIFRVALKRMGERRSGIIYAYDNRFVCTCENMEWLVRLPTSYKARAIGVECVDHDNKKIQELTLRDIGCLPAG